MRIITSFRCQVSAAADRQTRRKEQIREKKEMRQQNEE
jgi:hypothetical protein